MSYLDPSKCQNMIVLIMYKIYLGDSIFPVIAAYGAPNFKGIH